MNEDLEKIWDALMLPAFVLCIDNKVRMANSAAEHLMGVSFKVMRGRLLAGYFDSDLILLATIKQARLQHSAIARYGTRLIGVDRCNLYVSLLETEVYYALVVIQPIGVIEEMNLSYTSSIHQIDTLKATLMHEIRNPLAGISGAAQLLAMNIFGEDKKLLDMIIKETQRINRLLERVDHFTDQDSINLVSLNIHDYLDRALVVAGSSFASHVKIKKQFDPSLPNAIGDGDQLMQVFLNILHNAAEAVAQTGGVICLRSSYNSTIKFINAAEKAQNLPLQIEFIDNGQGIAPDLKEYIFKPFVSSKSNNSGLGLALVSKIMMNHGGLIACNSRPGRTCFSLHLPISPTSKD